MEDILHQLTDGLKHFEYNIEFGKLYNLDPSLEKEMLAIYTRLNKKQKNITALIADINKMIAKHPDVIPFQNYLSSAYTQLGDMNKAAEINDNLLKKHPDYVTGVINKAGYYFAEKDYEKIPEVLGDLLEIGDRFPKRKTFHISEILGFNRIVVFYCCATGKIKLARNRLKIMTEVAPHAPETKDANNAIMQAAMMEMFENFQHERDLLETYNEVPKDYLTLPQSDSPPVFAHAEIQDLYANTLEVDPAIIHRLLLIPRETLVKDLQEVIYDSIRRFKYYSEGDAPGERDFLFHSMVLLAELRASEALPQLLEILRQGDDYLDYWFGDWLTEDLWQVYYRLFDAQVYLKYLYERRNAQFARVVISTAFEQKTLAGELPGAEAEIFYANLLQWHIDNHQNHDLVCAGFLGNIVGEVLNLQLINLLPVVKTCYDLEIVDEMICGDYEMVEEEMRTGKLKGARPLELAKGFKGFYTYMVDKWYKNREDNHEFYDEGVDDNDYAEYEELDKETWEWGKQKAFEVLAPLLAKKPLSGRNDPCPCGSGKKYKKCCIDKEY